ncbi:MAG: acyl-CoA dehydratase activase-related protein [Slackia sp.]
MYENYPFWFTFFTKLGYRVVLSDSSSKKTYEAGIESMPSESVCYPAKLSHGHVMNLLDKDVDFIWMPCAKWERLEDAGAGNHYNCPIVASYSEALRPYRRAAYVQCGVLNRDATTRRKAQGAPVRGAVRDFADATCRRSTAPTRAEVAEASMRRAEAVAFKDDIRAKGGRRCADGGDRHAWHCLRAVRITTTQRLITPFPSF